jgi:hypothetical protein
MTQFRFLLGLVLFLLGFANFVEAQETEWANDASPELILEKADGYAGIWYYNQRQDNEYVYKYSGGLGTYCAKHIPFAVYSPEANKTFFVYGGSRGDSESLLHMVSYYDHETGLAPRPTILLDKKTTDAHDNPVLSIDGEGYLWVFCSSHGTSRPSYILKSVRPYDIDEFESVRTTNFSYPQIWHLDDGGFLFLHTRYANGHRRLFSIASPDGLQWEEPQMAAYMEFGHYGVSWSDGRKVGWAFNMHPTGKGLNYRTNLYYIETEDGGRTWRTAEGENVEFPMTETDLSALVHDYQSEGRNVYMKDVAFDGEGRPVILYVTSDGWEAGPENGPRLWQTACWTGHEWEIRGQIESDNNYDTGSLTIQDGGTWQIVGPTETGPQPYNPGGEVAMWESDDQGATWEQVAQLTSDGPYNHTYCRKPVDAHPEFYRLWADGHGRQPSDSRLYFCDIEGNVRRLPPVMDEDFAEPEAYVPGE